LLWDGRLGWPGAKVKCTRLREEYGESLPCIFGLPDIRVREFQRLSGVRETVYDDVAD